MENKINFSIPEEVVTEATQKLTEVVTVLQSYMIALTPDERRTIPKMRQNLSLCGKNTRLLPDCRIVSKVRNFEKVRSPCWLKSAENMI